MSSLRNSLHRRNHKERSQISKKAKFGILEKHKDYVLRARDYHAKQDRIKRLREKAAQRNVDEFYFAMTKEKTNRGVHVQDRGNSALPVDVVKLLKSQDTNYIRTQRAKELKKITQLKEQLTSIHGAEIPASVLEDLDADEIDTLSSCEFLAGSSKSRKPHHDERQHVLFNEDKESDVTAGRSREAREANGWRDVSDTDDLGWLDTEKHGQKKRLEVPVQNFSAKGGSTEQMVLLKELIARSRREKLLRYSERELEMQRHLMQPGTRRKLAGKEGIGEDNEDDADEHRVDTGRKEDEKYYKPRVYKWKLERK